MKSKNKNSENTQLSKALQALEELKVNVTTSDRQSAREKVNVSEFTIIQYLNGKGRDLDTAIALLQFFRERIEERDRLIA